MWNDLADDIHVNVAHLALSRYCDTLLDLNHIQFTCKFISCIDTSRQLKGKEGSEKD
jgi:hypothetical protein